MARNSVTRTIWVVVAFALTAVITTSFLTCLLLYGPLICRLLGFGSEAAMDRAIREADAGNVSEALKWCDEAIRRNPKRAAYYELRASLHARQGDYRSAVDDYTSLIQLYPDVPERYIDRGRAYEALGDMDSAMSDYCAAILLRGQYSVRVLAEARAGRSGPEALDEIRKLFEEAAAQNPQDQRLQQCLDILRHAKSRE